MPLRVAHADKQTPGPASASDSREQPQEQPTGLVDDAMQWLERELERPGIGALVVGGTLVVAATVAGVPETLVGAAGAYVVYRVLKRRRAKHARAA
jgi:hypothetical protein